MYIPLIVLVLVFLVILFVEIKNKKKVLSWILAIIAGIALLLTLSFHILPDHLVIFPKEHLTFSNTFIFQEDIRNIIDRYNDASFFEQQAIKREPLYRKLMERGIIVEEGEKNNADLQNKSTAKEKLDFLRDFEGKYPYEVKLLENTMFSQRLEKLVGNRYEFLLENFNVEVPIKISDDFFVAEACQAHNCGSTAFSLVYDFSDNIMYAAIMEEGEIKVYWEKGGNSDKIRNYTTMVYWED